MSIISILKEALEEVSSLQVATLYGSGITLDSGIDAAVKAALQKKIADQQVAVDAARTAWLDASDPGDRWEQHRAYRAAKSRLAELQAELNGVNPAEIFAKIQLSLGTAKTAGYSRLQLAGDGTHFLDADLGEAQAFLIEAHKAHVQAAQDSRQKLIDTAASLLKIGQAV
jgi:hypothetical protein